MPELPEVETVRRGLDAAMVGRVISAAEVRRAGLRFDFPDRFAQRLIGRRIRHVSRRAKYLLAGLDSDETLIVHLGMTGRFSVFSNDRQDRNLGEFYYEPPASRAADGPHDHVVLRLDDGTLLVYTDPRRFGVMDLCPTGALTQHRLLKVLGAEPLGNELNAAYLKTHFANRRSPLKAVLLDQGIVAGLGNIYVCEVLNRTRLSPRRQAGTLARGRRPDSRLERLVAEIRAVLVEAIEAGGSTLRDYAAPHGTQGGFQQRFRAYDREGKPCLNKDCKGIVRRIVQSGRSTFYCPRCQR